MARRTLEEQYRDSGARTEALRKRLVERTLRRTNDRMKALCAAHSAVLALVEIPNLSQELLLQCHVLLPIIESEKERMTNVAIP